MFSRLAILVRILLSLIVYPSIIIMAFDWRGIMMLLYLTHSRYPVGPSQIIPVKIKWVPSLLLSHCRPIWPYRGSSKGIVTAYVDMIEWTTVLLKCRRYIVLQHPRMGHIPLCCPIHYWVTNRTFFAPRWTIPVPLQHCLQWSRVVNLPKSNQRVLRKGIIITSRCFLFSSS